MNEFQFFLFFLFFLPSISFGQLKGTYCQSNGFFGDCYEFLDSNKFEYWYFSCTGGSSGKGFYALNKRSITFKFINKVEDTVGSSCEIVKDISKNDSIDINIRVLQKETKDTLGFSTFLIEDKSGNRIRAKMTDSSGFGHIRLKNSTDSANVSFFLHFMNH